MKRLLMFYNPLEKIFLTDFI
ncbi:UNVERIFIED_CONTAM: hypothetical protein GTU68_051289 [Idotea baltica]|nr:hypothetical protein [Idotea baltica]